MSKYDKEQILRTSGVNVLKCMRCGKCSATCPSYDEMEYHPHQFVYMVEKGEIEKLMQSPSIYKCLSCFACVERCPRGVEPAKLVEAVRLAGHPPAGHEPPEGRRHPRACWTTTCLSRPSSPPCANTASKEERTCRESAYFVCWCGSNIAATVDVQAVSEALSHEPGVVFSTNYQYMCSEAGQNIIKDAIRDHQLDRRGDLLLLPPDARGHLPQDRRRRRLQPLYGGDRQHPRAVLLDS